MTRRALDAARLAQASPLGVVPPPGDGPQDAAAAGLEGVDALHGEADPGGDQGRDDSASTSAPGGKGPAKGRESV